MADFTIIGGGIIGAAVACELKQRHPGAGVRLIEKEAAIACHQTGRNSGVIHAGVYYEPGSLKARFCRAGVGATIDFCKHNGIPYEQCGKLIVATNEPEQQRLLALYERAQANELAVELLDARQLSDAEPHITGTGAIFLRSSGIVSYRAIAEKLIERFEQAGGSLTLGREAVAINEDENRVLIRLSSGELVSTRRLIVCAGLMADRLARLQGLEIDFRIVPYRGEYFRLPPAKNDIVRHLIYPVPDPALPFLGVHLTRMIDGSVTVGPSALQGWKREGYGRINFSLQDTLDQLAWPGFWRVSARFLGTGFREIRNALWKPSYLKQVRKYCPSITLADLQPHPAGVRAMAVSRDGRLLQDFVFAESARTLHVCSAPSPAATAAIPIGRHVCDRLDGLREAPANVSSRVNERR